jgi:hypothetical protein
MIIDSVDFLANVIQLLAMEICLAGAIYRNKDNVVGERMGM